MHISLGFRSTLVAVAAVASFIATAPIASAAIFNVNSTVDARDQSTADGLCKTAGNVCTLRAAIEQSNASGGTNTINVPPGTYALDPALSRLEISNATNVLTIVGTGSAATTIIDGQSTIRLLSVADGDVTLTNLVLQNGFANSSGGGAGACTGGALQVFGSTTRVRVYSSVIQANFVNNLSGGGICVNGANVTLDRTIVRNNTATNGGGGVRAITTESGSLQIYNSTFTNNATGPIGAAGGAIELQGTLLVVNSTISGNSTPQFGSAMSIESGSATIKNTTIADNGPGAQITNSAEQGAATVIESTIIGMPRGGSNCTITEEMGPIISLGHNLDSDQSCGLTAAGDVNGADPGLAALANNGGPTPTHALLAGSPAIDAGSNPLSLEFDQRFTGFARVAGLRIDIGSFESAFTALNFQGLWWNSPAGSESGWGINLAHQGSTIFATWFTYDAQGKPLWLAVVATATGPGVYSGDLFVANGPAFSAVPFDPAQIKENPVGTATFTVIDANRLSFSYTVDLSVVPDLKSAVTQTKEIIRQEFGPLPTCTYGTVENLATATNYTDLWWKDPPGSESGWGVNFTHQGDTIFATWFTYDLDGQRWWLAFVANKTGPGIYTGDVFTATGPAFSAVPFDPATVVETIVGTVTLTFTDGNHATFAYTVNGVTQSKAITRQVFAAPGTVCN
jgi:hypothetical protein